MNVEISGMYLNSFGKEFKEVIWGHPGDLGSCLQNAKDHHG